MTAILLITEPSFPRSRFHREAFDAFSAAIELAVGGSTFFKLEKALARGLRVAVDLPRADAFERILFLDEAAHVLGGIAEKEPDLVREVSPVAQPLAEPLEALLGVFGRIAVLPEERGRLGL